MSNRFHNKFHRENHHSKRTATNNSVVDASYDPIASYAAPFQGEFYTDGEIVTNSYIEAVSGTIRNDFQVGNNVYIGNNAAVVNDFSVGNNAQIAGNIKINQNGLVDGHFTVLGNLSASGSLTELDTFVTIKSSAEIKGNLTVVGNLSVLGDTSTIETTTVVMSSFSVVNSGPMPALTVEQAGAENIAYFKDDGNIIFSVNNGGKIGVNTNTPNTELAVVGSISATNNTFIDGIAQVGDIELASANVSTFSSPATASGEFLILNINGSNRAIRLWDFI